MDNTVSNESMEALKALSNINLQISEATNRLMKLQETETEYLQGREKKALDRIGKVLTPEPVVEKIIVIPVPKPVKNVEHIVTTEQMESLKALTDINLKISEAKNSLFKLQEAETEYLQDREVRAMDRINQVVADSGELVKEADKNHGQIKELLTEVSAFAHNLIDIQENFNGILEEFDQRNIEWERKIGKQQDDIAEIRKLQKVEEVQIENDKKSLEQARKRLNDDQRKLDSDRGTLQRAIERLKNNKI